MSFRPNPKPSKGRSRYPRWTLRGGAKVRLEDMTSQHIANTIRMLERKAKDRWPEFVSESMASMGFDIHSEAEEYAYEAAMEDNEWEVCLHPMYEHLVAEAKRRGIDVDKLAPEGP